MNSEIESTNSCKKCKQTNQTLNVIKCLSALCVIAVHCTIDRTGKVGIIIDALIRFAVPIFFMISGYYSMIDDDEQAKQKYKSRIIKLIKLIIISAIIYFIYYYINGQARDIINWGVNCFTIQKIYTYVLLSVSPMGIHLWFLSALLYCYIYAFILKKYNIDIKKFYKYIPILLLCNIFLGEVCLYNKIKISNELYRNFIFTGLPFYLIGYYIKNYTNEICNKIGNKSLFIVIIVGCLMTVIERLAVGKLDTYIGTIMVSIGLFTFAVKNPNILKCKPLEFIGGKLYTWIYIMQQMVIWLVRLYEKKIGFNDDIKYYMNVIIVFVITIVIAMIIYYIGVLYKKIKNIKLMGGQK